jgi:hypothetical protein
MEWQTILEDVFMSIFKKMKFLFKISIQKLIYIYRQGDCYQIHFVNSNIDAYSSLLDEVQSLCQNESTCEVSCFKRRLADCQSRNASFFHVDYECVQSKKVYFNTERPRIWYLVLPYF